LPRSRTSVTRVCWRHGVDVVVHEPGGIATEWGGIAADKLEKSSTDGAYAAQADAVASSLRSEANAKRSSPPSGPDGGRAVVGNHGGASRLRPSRMGRRALRG
jgi:hypothetical protein